MPNAGTVGFQVISIGFEGRLQQLMVAEIVARLLRESQAKTIFRM